MSDRSEFTNLFQQTKTLSFRLLPVAETQKHMADDGIIKYAEERAAAFEVLKKVIDRNFKEALSNATKCLELDATDYSVLYYDAESDKTELWKEAAKLRTALSGKIRENPILKKSNSKVLLKLWKETSRTEEEFRAVEAFEKNYTGLCADFVKRRLELFDDSRKHGRVAYRAIDENLPIFLDNMLVLKEALNRNIFSLEELESAFADVLSGREAEDMFIPSLYGNFIGTEGIGIYNAIVGGYTLENGQKIQGINERINLYRQANKGERVPLMTQLKKRILSDEITFSIVPTRYEDDKAFMADLKAAIEKLTDIIGSEGRLKAFLTQIDSYDTSKIFVSRSASTDLALYSYGSWHTIEDGLGRRFDNENPRKVALNDEKYVKAKDKYFKQHAVFSLSEMDELASIAEREGSATEFLMTLIPKGKDRSLYDVYDDAVIKAYSLFNVSYEAGSRELMKNKHHNIMIKAVLDSALEIVKCVRALGTGLSLPDKDLLFASELEEINEELDFFNQIYNKSRNYLTSNPWDGCREIQLDFGYSTFLNGWSLSKERENGGIILIKDGKYYLGIYNRKAKTALAEAAEDDGEQTSGYYEKIDVNYGADMNKTLPHVFFSSGALNNVHAPSPEVLDAYLRHKQDRVPYTREEETALISYYIDCCRRKKEWDVYGFAFKSPESYASLNDFVEDAQSQAFVMSKRRINATVIDNAVKENHLYLFQIYDRDFAPGKHGTKERTFTIILKSLFAENNLNDIKYQLGGNASISFREPVINAENAIVHKAGTPIRLKQPRPDGPKERTFDYDIIKKKHYTEPTLILHLPVTLNYKQPKDSALNSRVNDTVKNGFPGKPNIIAIKRGNKNLVYLVVLDADDRIVEQRSLNAPREGFDHDFAKMLDERMSQRNEERRSWQTVTEIKDMKKGYLSYVVSEISNAMLKYFPCFLVLEDLSNEQRSRCSFEKSLYYKFEEAIINKLSYIINKNATSDDEIGSAYNALQLSCLPPRSSLSDYTGKQLGFVLFASGVNTDNVCPVTGFAGSRIFIDTKMSVASAKEFIKKFDRIELDQNGLVRVDFDLMNFVQTVGKSGKKSLWKAYSYGTRTVKVKDRETGKDRYYEPDLTESFLKLFRDFNIDTEQGNLIPQFLEIDDVSFWRGILTKLMLLFRLRNEFGLGDEYLVSPIMGPDGKFFDSRRGNRKLPCCADSNGAYNLARKGRLMLDRIADYEPDSGISLNLFINNADWFNYIEA